MILAAAAFAGGLHAGIPVVGVAGIGAPVFGEPSEGWAAPVEGGRVRVFVGESSAEAAGWLEGRRGSLKPLALRGVDEAWGDPGRVVFRDGNVAAVVEAKRAKDVASRLENAIVDAGPRAVVALVAVLGCTGREYRVVGMGTAAIGVPGKTPVVGTDGMWWTGPEVFYVWDRYGRVEVKVLPDAPPPNGN